MDRKKYARLINEWAESGRDWQKYISDRWCDSSTAPLPGDDLSSWRLKPEGPWEGKIRIDINGDVVTDNVPFSRLIRVREVTDDKPKLVVWMADIGRMVNYTDDSKTKRYWIECDETDSGAVRVEMEE